MDNRSMLWVTGSAAAVAVLAAILPFFTTSAATVAPPAPAADGAADAEIAALARDLSSVRTELRDLAKRVDALSAHRGRAEESTKNVEATPAPGEPAKVRGAPATQERPNGDATRDRFRSMLDRMFRQGLGKTGLSPGEEAEFWKAARTTGVVDELLAELEATVAKNPHDLVARMDLADVYTCKLTTIPGGPEQGVWGNKAEEQWKAVIEVQPDHWQARFALGFNYSMYPEFVDHSREAIEHLEVARRQLTHLPREPRHAETFPALARMYERQRQPERARAVLDEGRQLFPDHEGIRRAWESHQSNK